MKTNYRSNYFKEIERGSILVYQIVPFLTPVTGINIDSTEDLSDRDVIIAFKDTITTIKG